MNPIIRTLVFVGAAVLSLGAAGLTYWSHRPAQVDWAAELGQEFFPEFKDPNKATSLQVATFDKAASKTSTFSVDYKDGKWRIPSHNNYPADGKDRLKSTAASVIGITRGTLVGKTKEAHKEHNLLDPLDASITETEGRGDRITLRGGGDTPLVDLIIGKKKEGSNSTYYIRKSDEDRFFLSEVKIELSTKFKDWIEPDLLSLKQDDIKSVMIDRYSVDEAQGAILQAEQSVLSRESATADWKIDGIDATTVKPKTSVISAIMKSFDELQIVGVRRKPEGLSASLAGDEAIKLTNSSLADLQSRGYFYHPKRGLVSNEGDLLVSTFEGVSYVLRFGEVFTGTDIDIEVGSSQETEKKPAEAPQPDGAKPVDPSTTPEAPAEGDSVTKKNRFVFITAQFDEAALGPAPVEPKKPEVPKDEAPAADTAKPTEATEGDKPIEPTVPVADPKAVAKNAYEADLKKFETDSDVYRIRKKDYDEKKTSGEKKAKQLNARFADWYYVISEDLFTELRVKPEDLVEPVVAAPGPGGDERLPVIPPLPSIPKPEAPAAEDAPAAEPAPPIEGDKPAEPKTGDVPAEPQPVEKPAAENPPATEPVPPAEGDKPGASDKPAAEAETPAASPPPAVEGAAVPPPPEK